MNSDELASSQELFGLMFKVGLERLVRSDVEGWSNMWHENGSIEFPFSGQDVVRALNGRTAIQHYFRDLDNRIAFDHFANVNVHQSIDPNTLFVEYTIEGTTILGGRTYSKAAIGVVTLRDGLIEHYREYLNPLSEIRALGDPEALVQAFSSFSA